VVVETRSGLIAIQWSCWQRSGSHDPAEIMSADTLVIDAFDRTFAFEGCRDCPRTGELLPVHDGCAELSFTEPLAQAPALGSEVCDTRAGMIVRVRTIGYLLTFTEAAPAESCDF